MSRPGPDPAKVATVLKALRGGESYADAGRRVGVSDETARRWHRAAMKGSRDPDPPTPAPSATPAAVTPAAVTPAAVTPAAVTPAAVTKRLHARKGPEPSAIPETPPEERPALATVTGDALTTVEGILRELEATVKVLREVAIDAKAAGNFSAAQRAIRDLGGMLNTIARVRKQVDASRDSIRVTREELEAAADKMRGRIEAIASRGPMRCAACSRELSIELAGAARKIADAGGLQGTPGKAR